MTIGRWCGALLILLAGARLLKAQGPGDAQWGARIAAGMTLQGAYPYANSGLALGGTITRTLGERTLARLDVTHTRFAPFVDLTGCNDIPGPSGPGCVGARAPDKQQLWLLGLTVEARLHQPGFYVLAGLAAANQRGSALDRPGLSPGATAGIGLRFGETLAMEARVVQLLGPRRREGWFVPLVVSLGP